MVSLPVAVAHDGFLDLFPGAEAGTLYSFDGAYEPETVLAAGGGYWLYYASMADVTISGDSIAALEVELMPGWNLIGGLSVGGVIEDPAGVVMPGTLYGFDGAYELTEVLEPGRGYWVSASEAGTILIQPAE